MDTAEIAIIGAGIIGIATAAALAQEGREVVLIDPKKPGSGASYGNAGTLAGYAAVPVGNPSLLRNLPQLLTQADSPFAMRWAALPQLMPWLLRFLRQSLPRQAKANARVLADLLSQALPAWRELAAEAEIADLFRDNGCLYVYGTASDISPTAWPMATRRELGIRQDVLTPGEVSALEPGLPPIEGRGLFFPDAMHVIDPGQLAERLNAFAGRLGARGLRAEVTGVSSHPSGVRLSGPSFALAAKKVVVAAGAQSRRLARQVGDRIPLETERGYHIEFPVDVAPLRRPVCDADLAFYMTPMSGRLRVAGTVELGGLEAPPNLRRTALLDRGVRRYFPNFGPPEDDWLGFRPSLPDSLPVIGPARADPRIVFAFGHGHLGLTLAAITGRLVADLIAGRGDVAERLRPYSASRF